jgi:hypothetical protein
LQAKKRKLSVPSPEKAGYARKDNAFLKKPAKGDTSDNAAVDLTQADGLDEDKNLAARLRQRLREKDDDETNIP